MANQVLKPGIKAPASGQYQKVGPRGGKGRGDRRKRRTSATNSKSRDYLQIGR